MGGKPGYKVTEIGEVPAEWEIVTLGEIVSETKNGFASGERDDGGIVQIRMNNVTTDGRVVLDIYLKVPPPGALESYLLKPGDLLFNNTNSIDLVGKCALFEGAPSACTFSNHFTRIRADKNRTLPEWILYHLLTRWNRRYFQGVAIRHVGQSAVHKGDLLRLLIPLPPVSEQQKVVSILSTVDGAIQKTNEIIAKTQELKKGLMQQLLTKGIGHTKFKQTEIGEIPEEWDVAKLDELLQVCQYGLSIPLGESGAYPVLRMNNFDGGYIVTSDLKHADMKPHVLDNFRLQKGDILFNRTNSYDLVGKVGIFLLDGDYTFASYLIRLRVDAEKADPFFLNFVLNTPSYQNRLRALATRGSSQSNINATNLKMVAVPRPPLEEQKEIADVLLQVDDKLGQERREGAQLERVKRGLMRDLLTGKVRVKLN